MNNCLCIRRLRACCAKSATGVTGRVLPRLQASTAGKTPFQICCKICVLADQFMWYMNAVAIITYLTEYSCYNPVILTFIIFSVGAGELNYDRGFGNEHCSCHLCPLTFIQNLFICSFHIGELILTYRDFDTKTRK